MSPTSLLLHLIPNSSSLLELARWLDAEGATSRLSIYIDDSSSARNMAGSILDGIHSEEALSILVERLCKLRPMRAGEIRGHLTYSAILQERNSPVDARSLARKLLADFQAKLSAFEEKNPLSAKDSEALAHVYSSLNEALSKLSL